jgi:E1A/CREB-binding protein
MSSILKKRTSYHHHHHHDADSSSTCTAEFTNNDNTMFVANRCVTDVIKQQRIWLLLLRHASRCTNDPCDVTPHCASMRTIWIHVMSCEDKNCTMPSCEPSRYVLSHYSRCIDGYCALCQPVRDGLRRKSRRINAWSIDKNAYIVCNLLSSVPLI